MNWFDKYFTPYGQAVLSAIVLALLIGVTIGWEISVTTLQMIGFR